MSTAVMATQIVATNSAKRILVASFFGLVMGCLCASAAFSMGILKFTPVILVFVLLNRTVMGAAIGISGLKMHWAWNGIVIGMVTGSVFSYYLFMNVAGPLPAMNAMANGLFGFLIEFFTTVVFKQPSLAMNRAMRAA